MKQLITIIALDLLSRTLHAAPIDRAAMQAKIRAEFLLPRLVRDELRLIKDVVS